MPDSPMRPYHFAARIGGEFLLGLAPSWSQFWSTSGLNMIAYAPPIHEIGGGHYGWSWDSARGGDVFGVIDLGPATADPFDRYLEVESLL